MTMDRLTRTVREQIALGRLLPLGAPPDAVWITERATVRALRQAVASLPGIRLGDVAVSLADPPDGGGAGDDGGDGVSQAYGAAPVGALPHVPLRVEAAFEAAVDEPLPRAADRLREAIWQTARERLGLAVRTVDLQVTGLIEADSAEAAGPASFEGADGPADDEELGIGPGREAPSDTATAVRTAVTAVPGVARLTRGLAGLGPGVRVRDLAAPEDVPGRQVQVQIAVAPGHWALEVARAVAGAAARAAAPGAPGPVLTAVVVTEAAADIVGEVVGRTAG
ncbi:hypothetical protein [Streptomyces sp. CA-111067]|uniref:hypothetical protein n=1 Tax=Streptomyces sp. CA-111067 TaxID=3240046 RepID=UPI003D97D47C